MARWQQTDRVRTKAISLYSADHRAAILQNMIPEHQKNKNTRRRELLRVGRIRFNQEPMEEQGKYMQKAKAVEATAEEQGKYMEKAKAEEPTAPSESSSAGEKAAPASSSKRRPRSSGVPVEPPNVPPARQQQGGEQQAERSSKDSVCSTAYITPNHGPEKHTASERSPERMPPSERGPEKLQASESSPKRLRTSVTVDCQWEMNRSPLPLHDRLVRCTKSLRAVYGDATTFEVLAVGTRMLAEVDILAEEFRSYRASVKVAAVAGLAAKQVHSSECVKPDHVITLWAKIAGQSSEPQVRAVERMLLVKWARQS